VIRVPIVAALVEQSTRKASRTLVRTRIEVAKLQSVDTVFCGQIRNETSFYMARRRKQVVSWDQMSGVDRIDLMA
jgi:hypothetical protein